MKRCVGPTPVGGRHCISGRSRSRRGVFRLGTRAQRKYDDERHCQEHDHADYLYRPPRRQAPTTAAALSLVAAIEETGPDLLDIDRLEIGWRGFGGLQR